MSQMSGLKVMNIRRVVKVKDELEIAKIMLSEHILFRLGRSIVRAAKQTLNTIRSIYIKIFWLHMLILSVLPLIQIFKLKQREAPIDIFNIDIFHFSL